MARIRIEDLKTFCKKALVQAGMKEAYGEMSADVLAETDAFGTHSHGAKNLHSYIKKTRAGGADIGAEPEILLEGPSFAVMDAHHGLGLASSCIAMELACEKAAANGIALVTVKNSCHFGAAGYYANIAARKGLIGISMSNVDPNMAATGSRGMVLGNNPFAYAVPGIKQPTVFLDIAMSNVASLKVVQARKDGKQIPDTWIVDKDGVPTTDPSHYPEEGAMQPMAGHKGYGLSIMVDVLTGALSEGAMSMMGDIVSWCFQPEKHNNVCHTFIAIDPSKFSGSCISGRIDAMTEKLQGALKANGVDRIYMPGEIEWSKHKSAEQNGIPLPPEVFISLSGLADEMGIALPVE